MNLVYLWINKSKNSVIDNQGFNFGGRFNFTYENNKIIIKENANYIEDFYNVQTDGNNKVTSKITNVTAIVGANGSGKTTILTELISRLSINTYFGNNTDVVLIFEAKKDELITKNNKNYFYDFDTYNKTETALILYLPYNLSKTKIEFDTYKIKDIQLEEITGLSKEYKENILKTFYIEDKNLIILEKCPPPYQKLNDGSICYNRLEITELDKISCIFYSNVIDYFQNFNEAPSINNYSQSKLVDISSNFLVINDKKKFIKEKLNYNDDILRVDTETKETFIHKLAEFQRQCKFLIAEENFSIPFDIPKEMYLKVYKLYKNDITKYNEIDEKIYSKYTSTMDKPAYLKLRKKAIVAIIINNYFYKMEKGLEFLYEINTEIIDEIDNELDNEFSIDISSEKLILQIQKNIDKLKSNIDKYSKNNYNQAKVSIQQKILDEYKKCLDIISKNTIDIDYNKLCNEMHDNIINLENSIYIDGDLQEKIDKYFNATQYESNTLYDTDTNDYIERIKELLQDWKKSYCDIFNISHYGDHYKNYRDLFHSVFNIQEFDEIDNIIKLIEIIERENIKIDYDPEKLGDDYSIYNGYDILVYFPVKEKETITELFKSIVDIFLKSYFIHTFTERGWRNLSSGENAMLSLFSRFYSLKYDTICNTFKSYTQCNLSDNIVILIDEVDLYFHPEWQQKIVLYLLNFLPQVFDNKNIQVILTSHSPFILSDIPRHNTIFMESLKENEDTPLKCMVLDSEKEKKQTFASNIHNLYLDSFFLTDTIGEFSKKKIKDTIKFILECKNCLNDKEHDLLSIKYKDIELMKKEIKATINIIGEPVIKRKLESMYRETFPNDKEDYEKKVRDLESKISTLQQLLNEGKPDNNKVIIDFLEKKIKELEEQKAGNEK